MRNSNKVHLFRSCTKETDRSLGVLVEIWIPNRHKISIEFFFVFRETLLQRLFY